MSLPFSNVKNPRRPHHHSDEARIEPGRSSGTLTRWKTSLGYVLKAPVPVVIVVRAELRGAFSQLVPRHAIECHAHVVLAGYPWYHFGLHRNKVSIV